MRAKRRESNEDLELGLVAIELLTMNTFLNEISINNFPIEPKYIIVHLYSIVSDI